MPWSEEKGLRQVSGSLAKDNRISWVRTPFIDTLVWSPFVVGLDIEHCLSFGVVSNQFWSNLVGKEATNPFVNLFSCLFTYL